LPVYHQLGVELIKKSNLPLTCGLHQSKEMYFYGGKAPPTPLKVVQKYLFAFEIIEYIHR